MVSVIRKIVARYEADVSAFERGIADAGRKHDDFTKKVVKGTESVKGAQDSAGRSSGALGDAIRKTGSNFDGVVPKISRARDEMGRFIGGAKGAEEATTVLGKSVTVLGQNFTGTFPGMVRHVGDVVAASGRLKLALGGAVTVATGLLATSFVQLADQSKAVDNQLRGIGAASDEMRAKVYALAVETRTPLESTIGLLRSMQKSLSTQTLDQTLRQVGTLNRLLTVGGLDANARGSVALQFGQALQSGILQGDELRSLRESAPFELMDAIAKRAGGTVETLKDLGTQGKLTRDVMVGALEDLESISREKFGAFEMTVSEAMVVFNTALVGAAGEIDNAIRATDFFASALAGMAGLLRDHSGALAALAQALGAVAQLALMAAGARGLAALLGPLGAAGAALPGVIASFRAYAAAMGSVQAAALATAVAQQSLMRGLSSVTAMMGGPLGVAIFAAVGAMTVMARLTTTVAEDLDAAAESMESYRATATKLATAQGEIDTDRARLVELNKKITESIDAQGSAAEAVAGREAAAINARIAKNQELLHVYHALAAEELARSRSRMEQAERELRSQAALAQDNIVGGALAYFGNDDITREYANDLSNRAASGERLAPQELEFLQLFARIEEQREKQRKAEIEWADAAPGMANAHIRAWQAAQKAATDAADLESKAVEALNKKYDERATKLAELQKQLAAAQQQVATLPAGDERNAAVRAVGEAERQIRELRDVEERVASVKDEVDRMNAAMAQSAGMFDPNGVIRNLIKEIEAELRRAELAGENLDEVRLTQLETALAGLVSKAKELGIELRTAASTDFDNLVERMRGGALPYAQDVTTAGAVNTNMVDFIKRKESMSPTPYNDEGTLRAGYGSDLIYKQQPDGVWVPTKVFAGMTVSQREADYSLQMRLTKEFLPPIIQAIGLDKWNSYNSNQQAALASLSWNYGAGAWTNPNTLGRVAEAARSGSSQDVAAAIATLAMQKTRSEQDSGVKTKDGLPMNYHRRMEEAGLFGDTSATAEQAAAITKEYQDQANLDAQRKKRQDDYLASLKDENELLALKASLNGKSSVEQDYQIRVHQALSEATAAGIDLESRYLDTQLTMRDAIIRKVQDEMQAEAELNATREVERLKQIEHEKELQKERERVAERAAFHKQVEQDIQGIIVGSIMKTGDWREMAGRLIEQLAQAYLYAGLFNSGPLARKDGGSGLMGWLSSGLTNWLTGGATTSANGNIMTDAGPVRLNRYAYGGIARSPQLSIFGEGRQPEAYVPLPDGRTIPVTIKTPEVPSLAGVAAPQTMKLQLDLNNEMLEARIVDGSTPVAVEVTRQGIGQFSQNELPGRVRQSNQDPKRVRS